MPERVDRRRKPRARSDQDLDRIRDEWIGRYNARLHALGVLGLSVGTPKEDVVARYEALRASLVLRVEGADTLETLDAAFALLRSEQ